MYSNLFEKYIKDSDQEFKEEINQLEDSRMKRDEDLFKFIDEFIVSEEYAEYVENKKSINKECKMVQYDQNDLIQYPVLVEDEKYPLTADSKKMFAFTKHFEKYVKRKENQEVVKRQERGIQIIKDRIAELKVVLQCTREKKLVQNEEQNKKLLEMFCNTFNIDYSSIKLKNKTKVEERIICYQKIIHSRNIRRRLNIMTIVRKLTEEYTRTGKKKIVRIPFHKAEPQKINVAEIFRYDAAEKKMYKSEEMMTFDRDLEDSPKEPSEPQLKDKNTKVKDKDKKIAKIGSTIKSSKSSKKSSKKEPSALVLPVLPLCNKRNKISTEVIEKMSELLQEFRKFDDLMEDKHMLSAEASYEDFEFDGGFLCTPEAIEFNNFVCGKKYKKKFIVLNKSKRSRKFRLSKITSPNEYDVLLFKIKPLPGIQRVASGCTVTLVVTFTPLYDTCALEANIEFLSYDVENQQYRQFSEKIRCMPPHANLKISPSDVSFGRLYIWQAKRSNTKTLKLKNEGKKPCKAVIKKIFDPMELSVVTGEEENQNISYNFANNIVEQLFQNVFNNFSFESSFIEMNGLENFKLDIKLKNVDHVGDYFEKYLFDIYEEEDRVGSQELVVSAEVTGHFIELSPEVLDFGVCILNSIYQVGLEVYNKSSCTQTIAVKFPSSLVDFMKADVSNLYVPPKTRRTIWLKFLPRKHILTELIPYFDESTRILEFPVHICLLSRNYSDIPPVKASIFAVLTDTNDTNIIPTYEELSDYFPAGAVGVNLGECSIFETVSTDVIIENDTSSPQIYGFVDLPQCLTISPNFGFCEIGPGERKTLKMYYHPTIEDIKKICAGGKFKDYRTVLKLNMETLSSLGQIKQTLDGKKLRNSIELMMNELRNPVENDLVRDIKICMESIKSMHFSQRNVNEDIPKILYEYKGEGNNEIDIIPPRNALINEGANKRSQLTVHAKIIRPLLQLSCQHVEFPDTPCGSYSTTEIELEALTKAHASKCDFLRNNSKQSLPNYGACFKITGDNDQFRVEPSCGILTNGQIRKIVLIAKARTQDDIIKDTAKSIKYSEIYEMKKHEIELARSHTKVKKKSGKEKGSKGGKKEKEKKISKKKVDKHKKESDLDDGAKNIDAFADITITDEEIKLTYLDYYPAEMCYWRSLEPYTIKSKLMCNINYDSPNMNRKPDIIYLDVSCKVIKPDFITNLKQQRINFGIVPVGISSTEYVILQNINYTSIEPVTSLLNPVGPFRIPFMRNRELPPENYWKLPITFEPVLAEKVEEYFEITSGKTVLPLILEGTGITPELHFKPNFLVYRLDTKSNKITNKCGAALTINFEKVLELEGFISTESSEKYTNTLAGTKINKMEKNSKKKSDKGKNTDKRSKKSVPPPKFSDRLTEMEESSIRENFKTRKGESFFGILNIEEDQVKLPQNSTKLIKLGFGTPDALLKKKREMKEKGKNAKKEKTVKDKDGSGKSKDSKKGTAVTYQIVKYNIKVSNSFIRDIILICNFK